MRLGIVPVGPEDVTLWRDIHNAVIPAHTLTSDDVHERRARNSLTLAYERPTWWATPPSARRGQPR